VSRDGDRRDAQFVIPCASGVSSALWPASRRRSVATNWFAQQRRFFIMRGIGWSYVRRCIIQSLRLTYPLLISALLVAGIALAIAVFQYWVVLFMLAVIWSVLIVVTTRFLCDKFYRVVLISSHKPHSLRSRALSALPQFPETPMPATPLIRVLETIDLSTMDVEQFIANEASEQVSAQMPIVQEKHRGSRNMSL
jgi:hypothetical protein